MIDIIFYYGTDIIFVRVKGADIVFSVGSQIDKGSAPIDNLQLNYGGVIKEFPDLQGKDNWKEEAIRRFKNKIKEMSKEADIAHYIIDELKQVGYVPKFKQIAGFRREIIR